MGVRFSRSSGVLLHPTSLPGPWGIGDLGIPAYQFINFLADAGQSLWQVLPLNPTGFGDSPYQSPSAFAGNPLLISMERLLEDGLLQQRDLYDRTGQPVQTFPEDMVDYDLVNEFKSKLLRRSFVRFREGTAPHHTSGFSKFCAENTDWLDDYALFIAIKEQYLDKSMLTWDSDIRTRKADTITRLQARLAKEIEFHKYVQYLFFSQWFNLKTYANQRGIQIIGDAPIFVSYDSSDVWANPDLYFLDNDGKPTCVAGVPPDFFSATGQRWGNPLYRWDRMAAQNYDWWIRRIKFTLKAVDILRLDHFRGFEAYWEVPAEEETAMNGRWVPGPGADFFSKVRQALGDLPIIAEDLGIITPEVEALRDQFELPGMKVLQFAFGDDAGNPYLPHNYQRNAVVYTGTHDNNTTAGWFAALSARERTKIQAYLGHDGSDIAWELMRAAYASVADIAIVPLQDILRLGTEARMNLPGVIGGNWAWRFTNKDIDPGLARGLRLFAEIYGRLK